MGREGKKEGNAKNKKKTRAKDNGKGRKKREQLTFSNSFSISPARMTRGPRTAYSITTKLGFMLPTFKHFILSSSVFDAGLEKELQNENKKHGKK